MADTLLTIGYIYLGIGILWMLFVIGGMFADTGFTVRYNGKRVYGVKKVLVTIFLLAYVLVLWPVSMGAILLG